MHFFSYLITTRFSKPTVLFWKCLHLKETENDAWPCGKKEGRMCLTDAAFSALLAFFLSFGNRNMNVTTFKEATFMLKRAGLRQES